MVFSKDKKTLLKVDGTLKTQTISIPVGITTVPAQIFSYPGPGCVKIPATVSKVAPGAFMWCRKVELSPDNTFLELDSAGALIDKTSGKLLFIPEYIIDEYIVPENVTEIPALCISVRQVSEKLNKIVISKNVKKISIRTLKSIRNIEVVQDNPYFTVDANGALIDRKKQEIVYIPLKIHEQTNNKGNKTYRILPINYVVPTDVIRIGKGAFKDNFSVKNIKFHNNFVEIDDEGCQNVNVKKIDIPNSVKRIGRHAFYTGLCTQCSTCKVGIDELTISAGVEEIGAGAFIGIKKLLLAPGNSCFKMDNNGILINKRKNEIIYIPPLKKGVLQIPHGITKIGDFAGTNTQMNGLVIPEGITELGDSAFAGTIFLRVVTLPNGLKKIGPRAFAHSGLSNVSIPESVVFVGEKAFEYCSLTRLIVPDRFSMTEIKKWGLPNYCKVIRISEMKKLWKRMDKLPTWKSPLDDKKLEKTKDTTVWSEFRQDNYLHCKFPTRVGNFIVSNFKKTKNPNEYEICYKSGDTHVSIHVYPPKGKSLAQEIRRNHDEDRKKLITLCNAGATDIGISRISKVTKSKFIKNCQYSFYRFVSIIPSWFAKRTSHALVLCFYKNSQIVKLTIYGFDNENISRQKFAMFAKILEQIILADKVEEYSLFKDSPNHGNARLHNNADWGMHE